jgi:hypothetical protein
VSSDTTLGIEAGSTLVWFDTTPRGGGVPSGVDQLRALGEPVGVGAGFDDGAAEGESSTMARSASGRWRSWSSREGLVGRDRDGRFLLALGLDLNGQLGAAAVQLHVPEFVDAQQIDLSVARDGLRQRLLVGGSTSSLASLVASVYLTRKPDIAASVPSVLVTAAFWDRA